MAMAVVSPRMGQALGRRHLAAVPPEHLRVEALTGRLDELEAAGWPPGALAHLVCSVRESAEATTSRAACWQVAQELAPPLLYGIPSTFRDCRMPMFSPNTLRAMAATAVAAALGHPTAAAVLGNSCNILRGHCIAEHAGFTCMGEDGNCDCMELAGTEAAKTAAYGLLYELLEGVEGSGSAVAAALLPPAAAWHAVRHCEVLNRRGYYRDMLRRARNRELERHSSDSGSGGFSEGEEPDLAPFEAKARFCDHHPLADPGVPREAAAAASAALPTPLAFAAATAACQLFPDGLRKGGGWLAVSLVKEVLGRPELPPLLRLHLTTRLFIVAHYYFPQVCLDVAAVAFHPAALAACPALHVLRLATKKRLADSDAEQGAMLTDAAQTLVALTEGLPATTFAAAGLANWLLGEVTNYTPLMRWPETEPARRVLAGLWDRLRPSAIDRAVALRTVGSAPGDWAGLNWAQGLVWQLAALSGVPWNMGWNGHMRLLLLPRYCKARDAPCPRLPLDVLARTVLGMMETANTHDLECAEDWVRKQLPYWRLEAAVDDLNLRYRHASKSLLVLSLRILMGEVRQSDAGAREAAVKECREHMAAAYRVGLDIAATMPLCPHLRQELRQ